MSSKKKRDVESPDIVVIEVIFYEKVSFILLKVFAYKNGKCN